MRYLGCAYYPEYWGMNRLREDIRLMLDAGINTVRMGEFAWCRLEPEEGVYNFDWLHESIAAFGASGINVVICTPTAAPPAWLTSVYPETLAVRADGRRLTHGARRHYCFTSPEYRRHCGRMAAKLAVELAGYGNIIASSLTGWTLLFSISISIFIPWMSARWSSMYTARSDQAGVFG